MGTQTIAKTKPNTTPYYSEYSQPILLFRSSECSTEAGHVESLFLLAHNARDNLLMHLEKSLNIAHITTVLRYINIRIDQHDLKVFPPITSQITGQTLPPWKHLINQHFRVVTRIIATGKTSFRMQHRFLTVPKSQIDRNFNDRGEDAKYQQLQEGDKPERQFASVEDGLVCIEWLKDENGRKYFKKCSYPLNDPTMIRPRFVKLLQEAAPTPRTAGLPRPENAFKFEMHLRESDEDSLGHVTNSRYGSLIFDVVEHGVKTGYYANGSGPCRTSSPLPRNASHLSLKYGYPDHSTQASEIAVPADSRFYKESNIHEIYVGYENELKANPSGIFAWSWVEKDRIQGTLDVVIVEICLEDSDGTDKLISLCRVVIGERQSVVQKALL
ncbi:hypothetical protein BGX27_010759 [Mortierella sp. AM989]|nr:hypothetical protein BGX27_010759 [Mortierella sp. AM989]